MISVCAWVAALVARGEERVGDLVAFHLDKVTGRCANLGCRQLIDRNPDLVETVAVPTDRLIHDFDTAAGYRAAVG